MVSSDTRADAVFPLQRRTFRAFLFRTREAFQTMNRLLLALLALIPSLFSATAHAQALPTTPLDGIVAVVEEDVILQSELDQSLANIRSRFANNPSQLPPVDVLKKQVLERLILMRLQLQRAEASGMSVGDVELDQSIARLGVQQGVTPDQMRAQLARDGLSFEAFRQQIRDEITVSRLQQSFVQSRVTVNDTEIENALSQQGAQPTQVHLGYILVSLPDGATPEQIDTARTKIEGIHGLIERKEMNFQAAAIRYSDHQTALEGGDMGWRGIDEIPPLFANALPSMQAGDISSPLRGPSGYSLIQLIERRDSSARETATEYHARMMMVRTTDVISSEQARAKIDVLRQRVVAGEDFAKVAREKSDDPSTRSQGGDMGWFPIDAWGNAVARVIQTLADNEISEPFASDAGWHLLQRLGTREQDVTDAARRARMREILVRRKADEEFDRFLRQLRDEAYVENRLTGAST